MESGGTNSWKFIDGVDLAAEQDDAGEVIPIEEELVEEVMRELYREIHSEPPPEVSAAATASYLPESCGASVSDSASTVMAGIDLGGKGMDGCDYGGDDDDDWLARVLNWGPLELDFGF